MELIPNNLTNQIEPVSFLIKFITESLLIEYVFSLDIGNFLNTKYARKILSECLSVNEVEIFNRKDGLSFGKLDIVEDYLVNAFSENAAGAISLAKNNLNNEELFLMNGFKTMFSSKLVATITGWLENKFMVIYRADSMSIMRRFSDPQKESIYIEKTLNEAATQFGISSNAIGYMVDDENDEAKLCSLFKNDGEKKLKAIPAELFESYGTIRFINLFSLVTKALLTGGTLVVDEFDASIHPMALMSILNVFHNDEVNLHQAQLIFNTHNPIFLNSNLLRRDEIKFVERDDDTHISTHYSLSDFGTTGENSARKGGDYMKNYFVDRYGAIRDIDFTPIFENLMEDEEEV